MARRIQLRFAQPAGPLCVVELRGEALRWLEHVSKASVLAQQMCAVFEKYASWRLRRASFPGGGAIQPILAVQMGSVLEEYAF